MLDETKSPASSPPEGEPKPTVDQPSVPSGVRSLAGSVQSDAKTASAASESKPAAPAKPAGPAPIPWDSPMVAKLKGQYGSGIREANTYLGQNYTVVEPSIVSEV